METQTKHLVMRFKLCKLEQKGCTPVGVVVIPHTLDANRVKIFLSTYSYCIDKFTNGIKECASNLRL